MECGGDKRCLCLISCLLGRPEPNSAGRPPAPKEPRPARDPGDDEGAGTRSRDSGACGSPAPRTAAAGTRPAASTGWKNPSLAAAGRGEAGNFYQGPLGEATGEEKGREQGLGSVLRHQLCQPCGAARPCRHWSLLSSSLALLRGIREPQACRAAVEWERVQGGLRRAWGGAP